MFTVYTVLTTSIQAIYTHFNKTAPAMQQVFVGCVGVNDLHM